MSREFHHVGVVGLGTMGAGIVEVFARAGLDVIAVEADAAALQRGRQRLERSTSRAVARGRLAAPEQDELLARIAYATDLAELVDVDLVVEAVPERLGLKRAIFDRLHEICRPEAVLATNTSSLSITEIAAASDRPGKVVGLHFFNPAPVMRLVEIVRSVLTEQDVVDDVEELAHRLGKVDVTIGDRAGFVTNALLFGYLNHAAAMVDSSYADREDIDAAMTIGCGLPMGPLALLDLIGLDIAVEILDTMYEQTSDRLHAPVPILRQLVTAGLLGRKSGHGFYGYAAPAGVADDAAPAARVAQVGGRPVQRIGIVGSGTMATAVAEVVARAGLDVHLVARSTSSAECVLEAIAASMDRGSRGELTTAERDAALGRLTVGVDLRETAGAQLVVEAVVEDLAVKQDTFERLDQVCDDGTILATTTAGLPVNACAAATSRAADVVGLHFVDPAHTMMLVEVVHTVSTAPEVEATAMAFVRRLGRHAVRCGDRAGFIVNALLVPYLNDAVKMLDAHYASVDDIDTAMKLGCGYPSGPFEVLDRMGTDVALAIQRALYLQFREPGFAPAPLLAHLVAAGRLGHSTGQGFRDYRNEG